MLKIETDNALVEIEPGSHFFLKRGEDEDDSIRIAWEDLDDTAVANLNQFVTMIEGSLAGMTQK
jgi:hypothetical protein